MIYRLPPLNALRVFEAAARHLSFKDAANELSITQAAVSHQIKSLEDYLGETEEVEIELPVSKELGRPEHHEYRWVTLDEAEELLPPRLAVVLEWAKRTISGS